MEGVSRKCTCGGENLSCTRIRVLGVSSCMGDCIGLGLRSMSNHQ